MATPIQRACCVCGFGSFREKWDKIRVVAGTTYVACDGHSAAEFDAAIPKQAASSAQVPPQNPPPAQPPPNPPNKP